ncbi:uncharacterized protein LOC111731534 [Pteropus vampyrus]|uniref:Uncharacterized protein LOC111731534 n=1 Tax=Pteropus vampyrus TaxID=132908 RepID=A0A6P6BV69_PTEVA|nr:uncharacterized protein LOC111731534 [Pteropus vampyrus]
MKDRVRHVVQCWRKSFCRLLLHTRPKKQLILGENYARYAAASDVTQGPTFPDVRAYRGQVIGFVAPLFANETTKPGEGGAQPEIRPLGSGWPRLARAGRSTARPCSSFRLVVWGASGEVTRPGGGPGSGFCRLTTGWTRRPLRVHTLVTKRSLCWNVLRVAPDTNREPQTEQNHVNLQNHLQNGHRTVISVKRTVDDAFPNPDVAARSREWPLLPRASLVCEPSACSVTQIIGENALQTSRDPAISFPDCSWQGGEGPVGTSQGQRSRTPGPGEEEKQHRTREPRDLAAWLRDWHAVLRKQGRLGVGAVACSPRMWLSSAAPGSAQPRGGRRYSRQSTPPKLHLSEGWGDRPDPLGNFAGAHRSLRACSRIQPTLPPRRSLTKLPEQTLQPATAVQIPTKSIWLRDAGVLGCVSREGATGICWDGGEGLGRAVRSALFSSGHDAVRCWEHSPALSGFRFFMENGDDLFAAVPGPRGTGHILLTFVCLAPGTRYDPDDCQASAQGPEP